MKAANLRIKFKRSGPSYAARHRIHSHHIAREEAEVRTPIAARRKQQTTSISALFSSKAAGGGMFAKITKIAIAPLRGLQKLMGKKTGAAAAVALLSGAMMFQGTNDVLARQDTEVVQAFGDMSRDIAAGAVEQRFGKTAGDSARSAFQLLNAKTNPDLCAKDSVRHGREEMECRKDMLRDRNMAYAAAGMSLFAAQRFAGQGDDKKTKTVTLPSFSR